MPKIVSRHGRRKLPPRPLPAKPEVATPPVSNTGPGHFWLCSGCGHVTDSLDEEHERQAAEQRTCCPDRNMSYCGPAQELAPVIPPPRVVGTRMISGDGRSYLDLVTGTFHLVSGVEP